MARTINSLPFICSVKIFSATGFNPGNAGIFLNMPLTKHAGQSLFMDAFASARVAAVVTLFTDVVQDLMTVAKVGLGCSCAHSMVRPNGF